MGQHFDYTDTQWFARVDKIKERLAESGVRLVRGMPTNRYTPAGYLASLFEFYKAHGIGLTASVDATSAQYNDYDGTEQDIKDQLQAIAKRQTEYGIITAIEGPNEPDLFWPDKHVSYKGFGAKQQGQSKEQLQRAILRGALEQQKDLYRLVKADPVLGKLPVYGPSIAGVYTSLDAGGSADNATFLGAGAFEAYVDFGNAHPYPGTLYDDQPFSYGGIDDYWNNTTFPSMRIDAFAGTHYYVKDSFYQAHIGFIWGKKPAVITEIGFATNQGRYANCTDSLAKKYIPRLFLEGNRLGFASVQQYTFMDDDPPPGADGRWGLLRADATPKTAFYAFKSLLSVVADQASPKSLEDVSYRIHLQMPQGYDHPEFVHHNLYKKSDGSLLLAIWHEVGAMNFNADAFTEVAHPSIAASLSVPGTWTFTVLRDDGANGLDSVVTKNAGGVRFVVDDAVTYIKIVPS